MKKEVVRMRDSALTRRKKKSKVRDCILTAINDAYSERKKRCSWDGNGGKAALAAVCTQEEM